MTETKLPFVFNTCLQCTLESRDALPQFEKILQVLQNEGFYGIELNLPSLDIIPPNELIKQINTYNLKLHMLATGAYARKNGLSLTDPNPTRRKKAIEGLKQNIEYAKNAKCGVIVGFLKGPKEGNKNARQLLVESLQELAPFIECHGVTTLLEATNHNECCVANTTNETLEILAEVGCSYIKLLPDTYHMHFDEPPIAKTLSLQAGLFNHLHLSDDNRLFPGFGTIDFAQIYEILYQMGYNGFVSVEGNIHTSIIDDILYTASYLRKASQRS